MLVIVLISVSDPLSLYADLDPVLTDADPDTDPDPNPDLYFPKVIKNVLIKLSYS
jgi:hypothetical protein